MFLKLKVKDKNVMDGRVPTTKLIEGDYNTYKKQLGKMINYMDFDCNMHSVLLVSVEVRY